MENAVLAYVGVGTPLLWAGFTLFVLAMLAMDLGVFHRKAHAVGVREALGWSVFWIALSLLFDGLVFKWFGHRKGTGVPHGLRHREGTVGRQHLRLSRHTLVLLGSLDAYRHRVLYYGILGALVLRAIFILVGASLLAAFHWMIYVFGGMLVITGLETPRAGGVRIPA